MTSNSGDVQAQAPLVAGAAAEKKHKALAHPPYFQMIKEAISALNEKGGSSPYAIAKYIEQKYQAMLPGNFRKILGLQLKNSVAKGKLVKIKASYKLSAAARRDKPKTTTKAARANPGKPTEIKKKKLPKMKSVNTMSAAKAAVKSTKKRASSVAKLKKMKSPAIRKANKASAA